MSFGNAEEQPVPVHFRLQINLPSLSFQREEANFVIISKNRQEVPGAQHVFLHLALFCSFLWTSGSCVEKQHFSPAFLIGSLTALKNPLIQFEYEAALNEMEGFWPVALHWKPRITLSHLCNQSF